MPFLQQTHTVTHRCAMVVIRPLGLESKSVFFSLISNSTSGEALSLAPFCLVFGSPVPVTRAVPQTCPLQCQLWRVPGHHQGLWVLGQHSWTQRLLKADCCFCPKDFPCRQRRLCCSIQSTLWSPPTLQTAFAPVLTGLNSAPLFQGAKPSCAAQAAGKESPHTFPKRQKQFHREQGLGSGCWQFDCVYPTWEFHSVKEDGMHLGEGLKPKLFALSFQHVLA